jgi:hypothetical protein
MSDTNNENKNIPGNEPKATPNEAPKAATPVAPKAATPIAPKDTPKPTPQPAPKASPQPAPKSPLDNKSQSEPQKKKKEKKKGGWLGKIVCLFLGFILGIGSVFGAVAGGVYYAATRPIDDTVNAVDNLTGANLYETLFGKTDENGEYVSGLLNQKYAEGKIGDLVGDVSEAIGNLGSDEASLAGLNEIAPAVEKSLDSVVKTLAKYGIPVETQALLNTPFKGENGLANYVKDSLLNASAGDLFQSFSGEGLSPLLRAICYGEEDVDYTMDADGKITMLGGAKKTTVGDLIGEDLSSVFNKITVDSVIDIDPDNSIMCSLAYGSANRYTVSNDKVTMQQILYTVNTSSGSVVLYDDADEKVEATVETLSQGLYKVTLSNEKVQYVTNDGKAYTDNACTIPACYPKVKIGDMQKDSMSLVDNILLKDALDITDKSHNILKTLAYKDGKPRTIGEFRLQGESLINDVYLSDVMTLEDNYNSKIVMRFLYGKQGYHYELNMVGGKPVVTMNEKAYFFEKNNPSNIYDEEKNRLSDISVDTAKGVFIDTNGREYPYSKKGSSTLNDGTQLQKITVKYTPTKISDLMGKNNVIETLINTLTIGEVFDDSLLEGNVFLKHVKNETINSLPTAIEKLTVSSVYAEEVYEEDGVTLKGSWKYLLTDPQTGKEDKTITVTEMQTMIDNMQENIHTAKLYDLKADGVLSNLSDEMLDRAINKDILNMVTDAKYQNIIANIRKKGHLGDLTVDEMVTYLDIILSLDFMP